MIAYPQNLKKFTPKASQMSLGWQNTGAIHKNNFIFIYHQVREARPIHRKNINRKKKTLLSHRTSLVVQCLGLYAFIAKVLGSTPGQGTKVPTCRAVQLKTNKQTKKPHYSPSK